MGLFRLAAIVAVGVSLLPAEREKQEQLYQRAASSATWAMTFCDRNAATCTQASSLWTEFSKKAEFGAKLAFDVIRDTDTTSTGKGAAASTTSAAPATARALEKPTYGALTSDDLKPAWRGKMASKSGG